MAKQSANIVNRVVIRRDAVSKMQCKQPLSGQSSNALISENLEMMAEFVDITTPEGQARGRTGSAVEPVSLTELRVADLGGGGRPGGPRAASGLASYACDRELSTGGFSDLELTRRDRRVTARHWRARPGRHGGDRRSVICRCRKRAPARWAGRPVWGNEGKFNAKYSPRATAKSPLDAAVKYAGHYGWPVFPCQWQGEHRKKPLTKNGFHDAGVSRCHW
jgi:hypothetical protein